MSRIICTLLCVLSVGILQAQNMRRIEGSVHDFRGEPVCNASLRVVGNAKTFKTGADGTFAIDVPADAAVLCVETPNYRTKYMEIDGTYMIFTLRPKSIADAKAFAAGKKEELERAKAAERATFDAQKDAVAAEMAKEREIKATARETLAKEREAERIALAQKRETEQAGRQEQKHAAGKLKRAELLAKSVDSNLQFYKNMSIGTPSKSYTELGHNCLYSRNGKELDVTKAFLCYNLGVKHGEKEALLPLGLFYETGRSHDRFYLEKDLRLALACYEKAAELNVPNADRLVENLMKKQY